MFKYNCLNPIAQIGLKNFDAQYEKTEDVNEAAAILVRSAVMHDMELSDNLLAVGRAGAGVNNIPLDKCAEKGIVVFNTPGANANGVKELVLAGMFLAARDVIGGINWVLDNKEDANIAKSAEKAKKAFAGNEIMGKKIGVIGLGAIGALVANAAEALGMEVYGYDPFLSVRAAWMLSKDVKPVTSLDEIYEKCDYITIHVPALADTKGMINAEAIAKMKDGVIFLNFSRDALVDTDAMLAALESGKVKRYVTDFAVPGIAGAKNAIVLPHLGASTEESEDNCAVMAVQELKDYLENGNIKNSVNYPACDMGVATKPRITILHKNVPNMIGQFTAILAKDNLNIANMANKSRGEYAYTVIDVDALGNEDVASDLAAVADVLKVRVIA